MKQLSFLFLCLMAWSHVNAQVSITYNNEAQWKTYDDFNAVFLDNENYIYKADTKQARADHRGNGYRDNDESGCAAAIWCQAIYYDMVVNAYNRAKAEGNKARMKKYKKLEERNK